MGEARQKNGLSGSPRVNKCGRECRVPELRSEKPCAHFERRSSPGCEQSSNASDTSPTKDMERNPLGMSDMVYASRQLSSVPAWPASRVSSCLRGSAW